MSIGPMATVAFSAEEEQASAYLAGVGPIMAEGSSARQALVDGLTRMRAGATVEQMALAEQQGDAFRLLRARLGRLTLPRSCSRCHAAVARWLELHEAACMTLAAGGPKALAKAGELVADARGVARQFTAEYTRLAGEAAARQAAVPPPAAHSAVVEDELAVEINQTLDADVEDALGAEVEEASDLDEDDELKVEKLAEHLARAASTPPARVARAPVAPATAEMPRPARNDRALARPDLHAAARANGDAAWDALAVVSQARGLHPHGQLGSWLAAVEAVLAASAAVTAFIVTAEVAVLD